MSIIDKAREANAERSAAAVQAERERISQQDAAGLEKLRAALRERRYGDNPDPLYDGPVERPRPCRYLVDGVAFVYTRTGHDNYPEIHVEQTCPLCGERVLTKFHGLQDLGKRVHENESGAVPWLHSCDDSDAANLARQITVAARRHGLSKHIMADKVLDRLGA